MAPYPSLRRSAPLIVLLVTLLIAALIGAVATTNASSASAPAGQLIPPITEGEVVPPQRQWEAEPRIIDDTLNHYEATARQAEADRQAEIARQAEAEAQQRHREEHAEADRKRVAASNALRAARNARRSTEAPAERPQLSGDVWSALARCESGGNPGSVSASGTYRGAFQFSRSTWESVGGTGDPAAASYGTQLALAQKLQARSGWGQWPKCSRQLGLR